MTSAGITAATSPPSSVNICDHSSPKCSDCAHHPPTATISANMTRYRAKLHPERKPLAPTKTLRSHGPCDTSPVFEPTFEPTFEPATLPAETGSRFPRPVPSLSTSAPCEKNPLSLSFESAINGSCGNFPPQTGCNMVKHFVL